MTEDNDANIQGDGLGGSKARQQTSNESASSAGVVGDDDDEPNIGGCSGYNPNSHVFNPDWRFNSVIGVFLVLTVLESINSTSTSTTLNLLGQKIGGTSTQLEWIGNAYMLSACVTQMPIASFANIYGRLPLVMLSFSFFCVGSIVCGAAPNIAALLAGRTIQGIGGAGTLVLSEVCISDLVPLRFRARYYSMVAVMWAIGAGIGPILGGGFGAGEGTTWRWIFYFNAPVCGVAILVTPFILRVKHTPQTGRLDGLKQIDWIGMVLFTGFSTAFVLGLTLGGVSFSWSSWNALLPLVLGAVGMVFTCVFEHYVADKPMFAVKVLFANRSASIAYVHAAAQGFMMESLPYYLPLFYQGVLGYSPVLSGVALLPVSLFVLPVSIVSGFAISRLGRYKWVNSAGWAVLSLGLGLLILPSPDHKSVGVWLGPLFPTAVGLGILYSVLGTAVQAPQNPAHWMDAAAMMSFTRSLGEAMGVAVGGSVFASQMASRSASLNLPPGVHASESIELISEIKHLHNGDPLKRDLQFALSSSMHSVYYVYLGICGLCFVLNFFVKEYSLDRVLEGHDYADSMSVYDAESVGSRRMKSRKGSAGSTDSEAFNNQP